MKPVARKIKPLSLHDQIAEWLINEISEERLVSGQRITEQFVADQFNVSRGPVRDAFRKVEQLGLVKLLPRRGVVVAALDLEELKELFEIRAALTRVAVCRAIDRASDYELQGFVDSAGRLFSRIQDEAKFFAASNLLGEEFLDLAGSDKLRDLMFPLHTQIMRYRHHGFSSLAAR
jgi:DNA-binding GntR family transcriptional regulator